MNIEAAVRRGGASLILGALSCLASAPALADLPAAEKAELEQRIATYRAQISQQQLNIAKMTAELQAHPTNPDVRKLGDFFATAAGHRSKAYYDQPQYIRDLVEKVEHDPLLALDNLATGVENAGNVAVAHFKIEIDRSRKFIALCRRQLKDAVARLDAAAKDPGDAWKAALGAWTDGKGTDLEIEQDADGAQAKFTALGGQLKAARAEVGDWLFANGKPSSDRRRIESSRGYTYVLVKDCPSLSPHAKAKVSVAVRSADELEVSIQAFYYNTRTCKWSDKFDWNKVVYRRKE